MANKLIEQNQELIDDFSELILNNPEYLKIQNNRFDTIEKFIQNSDSFDDMLNGIFDVYDDLDSVDYETFLSRIMFVINLFGFNSSNGNKS